MAARAFDLLFAWIALERRHESGLRNIYILPAVLFPSAGALGVGRLLPPSAADGWAWAAPPALFAAISLLVAWLAPPRAGGPQPSSVRRSPWAMRRWPVRLGWTGSPQKAVKGR